MGRNVMLEHYFPFHRIFCSKHDATNATSMRVSMMTFYQKNNQDISRKKLLSR